MTIKKSPRAKADDVHEALYKLEEELFSPSESTGSPWSGDTQHGGPAAALLARAVGAAADPSLRPVRLTIDLSRPLPRKPVSVLTRPVRIGRRIALIEATIECDGRASSHARALFLHPSVTGDLESPYDPLPGPDGFETGPLVEANKIRFTGFHTSIELRWVAREGPGTAAWFRMPMALVEGEELTPFQGAAAISDFANALARRSVHGLVDPAARFVNADLTVYFARAPVGEWIGMRVEKAIEHLGTGFVEVTLFDAEGRFGFCSEARLAI